MFTHFEKRRYRRLWFHEPVEYHLAGSGHSGGCLSSDLSEGGLRMNFGDFVPVGTKMLLSIPLGHNRVFDCEGKVVWVENIAESDRCNLGVEFVPDTYSPTMIKEFLEQTDKKE
ncbi:MAG: PilZ domain-containing protein [Candidatus Omnitrophica bacterium]|nr:PilZ domain-containing protein [Candidatus Omnitrophota bacterium]